MQKIRNFELRDSSSHGDYKKISSLLPVWQKSHKAPTLTPCKSGATGVDNRARFGGNGGFGSQKQMRIENYVRKANVAHTRENENESGLSSQRWQK